VQAASNAVFARLTQGNALQRPLHCSG
jgi:hypothetical protein